MSAEPIRLKSGRALEARDGSLIMGVVNITPDSFSDGGRFHDPSAAIAHALQLLDQGADVLDLGGESTRPGAAAVGLKEELRRVLPVVQGVLNARPEAILSIDTTKAEVARAALEAGAEIINDVSALEQDAAMIEVAALSAAPLVLMHRRGSPQTMQLDTRYEDLLGEVIAYLSARIEHAVRGGVAREQIIVDPGIGFGKSAEQGCELIARVGEIKEALGCPVLLGPSRKSFLGELLKAPVGSRQIGTAASVACGVLLGADIVRVHDVAAMREAALIAGAIRRARRA